MNTTNGFQGFDGRLIDSEQRLLFNKIETSKKKHEFE